MFVPDIELQSPETIRHFQEQELHKLLIYLQNHSPFYQEWFQKHDIDIAEIKTLDDLRSIPTLGKDMLQERNWDFLCVDKSRIAEYTTTSGTLGKPVIIPLTEKDLDRLAYNEYISFTCAGGSSEDIYQLMLTLDRQFMAGIAYYQGIRRLGAGVLRVGPGAAALQWENILKIQPTVLVAVPSFLIKLIAFAETHEIDLSKTSVKSAICIGENIRNQDFSYNVLGKKITEKWNIRLFSTYASTEMQTAFTECAQGLGGHHHPELLIVEILDTLGNTVPPGAEGEVTITTLGVEAMPLMRYRTGDICTYHETPCACGRKTFRLSPIIGRHQHMIKYKGTTLYPPALFDILAEMPEVLESTIEVSGNEIGTDEILLKICPSDFSDEVDRSIKAQLQAKLRVIPDIEYISMEQLLKLQLPEGIRKPLKFIDKRK